VNGTVPGQEPAMLVVIIVVGLAIFVPLFIYLSVKVGFKPTFEFFTIGLRPRKRHGQPGKGKGERHNRAPHA
jgi:hypothetical protein